MLEQASRSAAEATAQKLSQSQPRNEPEPQPAQPKEPSPWEQIADDDLVEGRTVKFLGQNIEQRLQGFTQAAQQLYNQNLSMLESLSRQSNPEIWQKYGDEIREIVERRKQQKIVDGNDYAEAIDIVRGRHASEITDELVQQRLAELPVTEGASGAGFSPEGAAPDYEIPEGYKKLFEARSISMSDIREHCRKMGITIEKYIEMMKNGQVIMEGDSITRSYDLIPEEA